MLQFVLRLALTRAPQLDVDVLGDELDSFATMTSCKRSWRLRKENDVDLTSEMGNGYVQLRLSGKTENRDDVEQDAQETTQRMSA